MSQVELNVDASRPAVSTAAARRFVYGLLALSIVAFVLRCVRLGAQSFWIDEVLSYAWIGEIDKFGFGTLLGDIHGPLHAVAIWLASRVSESEASLRFPSVLAGALAVPAIGLLGRALWGERAGLGAAALLTVSPFALYYSQECRNYSCSILFAILTLLAAWRFMQRQSVGRGVVVVLAELAGILSNLNGLFFTIGLGAWGLWVVRRNRRALVIWCVAHAVLAFTLVPYAWQIKHQVHPERLVGVESDFGSKEPLRGATTLHPLALPYTAFAFAAGYSLGPTLEELRLNPAAAAAPRSMPALLLVLLGFGVPFAAGLWRERRGRGLLLVPALVTCGWTVWLAATNVKPYNVRYLSVAVPAFLLMVVAGWQVLPRRLRAVAVAAACVASLWSCANYLFMPRYGRDDARGAVHYVATHAGPEDPVVQISLTLAMRSYYRDLGARPVHPPAAAFADLDAATRYVQAFAPAGGVLWYFECRPEAIDPKGALRKALRVRALSEEMTPFVGIRVHRFVLRPV